MKRVILQIRKIKSEKEKQGTEEMVTDKQQRAYCVV